MAAASTSSSSMAVSPQEVAKAQAHLRRMRSSLAKWLRYRAMNDQVMAGTRPTAKPRALAVQIIAQNRSAATEQHLADQLHTLLSEVMPNAALPDSNLASNPNAAVQLAQIAITGQAPAASPQATGSTEAWLWPVLIVGGLLLAITTAINSYADVAATQEQYACVQAGGCNDYSLWLKVGAAVIAGWFLWTQTDLKHSLGLTRKGG